MNSDDLLKKNVSIIIPIYNNFESVPLILKSLNNQKLLPFEVILIDSSDDKELEHWIQKKIFKYKLVYRKVQRAYPGKARNIGCEIAQSNYIGFIDSKTIPDDSWLADCLYLINNQYKCILGNCRVVAKNNFQKILRASSHGLSFNQTVPGTVIEKSFFLKVGKFNEHTRAGEDIDWLNKLKKYSNNLTQSTNINITYLGLPINLYETINKYLLYSFHTARINIQNNIKNIYLTLLLILSAIIIPKWNSLIGEWENNPLYVPNITKIYIIILSFIFFFKFSFGYFFSQQNKSLLFNYVLSIIFAIFLFLIIYRWNFVIADWMEDAVWYFPHITKIFLSTVIIISLIYRGIIIPTKRGINLRFLFPVKWILIGFLGLLLDLLKAPGYLVGSILSPVITFKESLSKSNKSNSIKKILVICPFPEGVQAGQRLKYEQHFASFSEQGFSVSIMPFINMKLWSVLYKKGHFLFKFYGILKGYSKRFLTIFTLFKYDIVYIFMWVTPFGPGYFERIYRFFSKKIIYDIEDNILVIRKNIINPIAQFKSTSKIIYLIKNSDQIITSAPDLNNKCKNISKKNNCTYICASINLKRYIPNITYSNDKLIIIGWTGTFSSMPYLKIVEPVFKELAKIRKFKLRIIGNFDYSIDGIDYEVLQWNKESEIDDLTKIDIGFYPLSNENEWISGKSGLKALQYMALGIPTITTNIGNVGSIINNMQNGILVNSYKEWINAFLLLIDNPNLRKKLGEAGRKTVVENYSTDVLINKYLKVLNSL